MKKNIIVLLFFIVCGSVIAEIISYGGFSSESFDIKIIQHQHMLPIQTKQFPEMKVDYSFTDAKKTYELRYSLFKQTAPIDSDIMMPYTMFILPLTLNISGGENNLRRTQRFNDNDVKNDFNGDFGTTVFIERPKSNFGKGFKYVMLNFYCKKNYGIVVQSFLFNNTNILTDANFMEAFNSFKFN